MAILLNLVKKYIPPIREHDVKNHFLYTTNPESGHTKTFSHQLQKSRKMYKENYISNVEIGDDLRV